MKKLQPPAAMAGPSSAERAFQRCSSTWYSERSVRLSPHYTPHGTERMAQRRTLPVLTLRGTVIFPGVTQPIAAGRPGTLRATDAALKGDRGEFPVEQRDKTKEPTL